MIFRYYNLIQTIINNIITNNCVYYSFTPEEDGEYTFNVYGTIYDELTLLKSEIVSLPYGISNDHVENFTVDIDDKIVIKGDYVSRFDNNKLTYSISYYNNGEVINSLTKDIVIDDKFVIEENIIDNADSFDFNLSYKGKNVYSYKNGVIIKVDNVKEILSPNKFNVIGEVINNRYKEGKIYLYSDKGVYSETFEIKNNKFDVLLDVDDISSYYYKILLNDKELYVTENKDYDSSYKLEYNKPSFNEISKSFNEDGTLNLLVPISFTPIDGYKIHVYLIDENNNVVDSKDSYKDSVLFNNIDISHEYRIGYQELYEVDNKEFVYGNIVLDDVLNIELGSISLNESIGYSEDKKVYISYSVELPDNIDSSKMYLLYGNEIISLDSDSLNGNIGINVNEDTFSLKTKLVIKYQGIEGEYVINSDETSYSLEKMKFSSKTYESLNDRIVIDVDKTNEENIIKYVIDGDEFIEETSIIIDSPNKENYKILVYEMNEEGEIKSYPQEIDISYHNEIPELQDYYMSYLSCGDINISYVNGESVILDFNINFESNDENVYAYVLLGDDEDIYKYKVGAGNLRVDDLDINGVTYLTLIYRIVELYDGIEYVVDEISESGTIDINGIAYSNINESFDKDSKKVEFTAKVDNYYDEIDHFSVDYYIFDHDGETYPSESPYTMKYENGILYFEYQFEEEIVKFDYSIYAVVNSGGSIYIGSGCHKIDVEVDIVIDESYTITSDGQLKVGFTIIDAIPTGDYKLDITFIDDYSIEHIVDIEDIYFDNYKEGYFLLRVEENMYQIEVTPSIRYRYDSEDEYKIKTGEVITYGGFNIEIDRIIYDFNENQAKLIIQSLPHEVDEENELCVIFNGNLEIYDSLDDNCVLLNDVNDGDINFIIIYQRRRSDYSFVSIPRSMEIMMDSSSIFLMEISFEARNPGEINLDYTDDLRGKFILDVGFDNRGADIGYLVELYATDSETTYRYFSKISPIEITDLSPEEQYTIKYYLYQEIDGVTYIYGCVYPSGTIEFNGIKVSDIVDNFDLEENHLYYSMNVTNYYSKIKGINVMFDAYDCEGYITYENEPYTLTYIDDEVNIDYQLDSNKREVRSYLPKFLLVSGDITRNFTQV